MADTWPGELPFTQVEMNEIALKRAEQQKKRDEMYRIHPPAIRVLIAPADLEVQLHDHLARRMRAELSWSDIGPSGSQTVGDGTVPASPERAGSMPESTGPAAAEEKAERDITVGGSGDRPEGRKPTSPVATIVNSDDVSPAYSSGTIDLGLDDLDDEVGTHPVSSTVGGRTPPDSPPEAPIPPPRPPPISSPAGSSEPWRRGSTPEIRHLLRTHAEGVLMIQACLRRAQANSFTMLHLLCGPAMDEMVRPPLGFRLPPHTRMGIGARTRARSACPGQRRPPAREAPMLAWFCSGLSPRCSSDRVKGGEELSRPSGTACTQNTAP